MGAAASGFDDLGLGVDQVVFDEVQAGLDVGVLKLDEVEASRDLLLHRDLIEGLVLRLLEEPLCH